jgi:hypothetical protein
MKNTIEFKDYDMMIKYFISSIQVGDSLKFVTKKETKMFHAEKMFFDVIKYTYEHRFNNVAIKSTFSSKDKEVVLHYLGLF